MPPRRVISPEAPLAIQVSLSAHLTPNDYLLQFRTWNDSQIPLRMNFAGSGQYHLPLKDSTIGAAQTDAVLLSWSTEVSTQLPMNIVEEALGFLITTTTTIILDATVRSTTTGLVCQVLGSNTDADTAVHRSEVDLDPQVRGLCVTTTSHPTTLRYFDGAAYPPHLVMYLRCCAELWTGVLPRVIGFTLAAAPPLRAALIGPVTRSTPLTWASTGTGVAAHLVQECTEGVKHPRVPNNSASGISASSPPSFASAGDTDARRVPTPGLENPQGAWMRC